MLDITPRHCSRLLKRYRQFGPLDRLLPATQIEMALSIIRERYSEFGPTLVAKF